MTLSCSEYAERLGDYVDGTLTGDDVRALETHVASCVACAEMTRGYRAIPRLARRATDVTMPRDVEQRILRLLAAARIGDQG